MPLEGPYWLGVDCCEVEYEDGGACPVYVPPWLLVLDE